METLISKLQYKNYERGEFSNSEMRTAEETIQLIKDYPWDEQRQLASVELTCPSVTIEHYTGKFLKIGPYFGGKFCLYLSDGRKISEKIVQHLEDSFEIINDFYCKGLYINLSKGHDNFYFGTEDDYKEYFKSDIINVRSYQNLNNRSIWSGYHVFEIEFKSGEQIRFPNLLLREGLFRKKFSEQRIARIHKKIPLI